MKFYKNKNGLNFVCKKVQLGHNLWIWLLILDVTNSGECHISLETFAECDINIVGVSCGQIAAVKF